MKFRVIVYSLFVFFVCLLLIHVWTHADKRMKYSERGVKAYAESGHGCDGALFLDPYIVEFLDCCDHQHILDAGCGAAPWAIAAAKRGATVCAIDCQDGMIQEGITNAQEQQLIEKIAFNVGDVCQLPYEDKRFDAALSLLVACNLPAENFNSHFQELCRVLKPNAQILVAAPTSLDVIFTNGHSSPKTIKNQLNQILSQINHPDDFAEVEQHLLLLTDVLSATFVKRDGKIELVTSDTHLQTGEMIWRKLPRLVVPNRYYSEENYQQAFANNQLEVVKTTSKCFEGPLSWSVYNKDAPHDRKLGIEYSYAPPFVLYQLKKAQ